MKDDLEAHKAENAPVNGHKLRGESPVHNPPGMPAGPDSKETADREATRYLSAATQVDIGYARNVIDRVLDEQLKALAPTFGVDIPVVVKWAMKAVRTRSARDFSLSAILALQCFFIAVLFLWWRWAWLPFLLAVVAAWLVVAWDYDERINKVVIAKMLHDRFKPEDAPSPPHGADLDRLDAVAMRREGNLVVFSGHNAFIGSGQLMAHRRLLLNVSGKKKDDGGSDRRPADFTSHDLQTAIAVAFGREHGLGKSLDNIRVYERLFVNGLHIQKDRQLLPNPQGAPPASVDRARLREAALNPSPDARTYVCVEMPGWQGQLVVTLFIRAVYAGRSLFVEWTFRVLPPIRAEFRMIDGLYEHPRYVQVKSALHQATG